MSETNFVSVKSFHADCMIDGVEQDLLWESRTTADRQTLLFTMVDGKEVRTSSIQEFLLTHLECTTFSIRHILKMLWNGVQTDAELVEVFEPGLPGDPARVMVRLELMVDGQSFKSERCDCLTEALWDIAEKTVPVEGWWLQTCFHCRYSYPAFPGPTDDRDDMRCYRDDPESFEEIQAKQKFASMKAQLGGHYFVDAFHSCAAWEPLVGKAGG